MNKYILSVIIDYEGDFKSIVQIASICFDIDFSVENDEGRLIAKSEVDGFRLEVIDKYDDLSDLLSDDNYVLNIFVNCTNIKDFIEKIKFKLNSGNIAWIKGVCIILNEEDITKNFFKFYP